MQWLTGTIEGLRSLLRRGGFEPCGLAVDGGRVGRVRASAPLIHRRRAERSTPGRRGRGRCARLLLEGRKSLAGHCGPGRVVGVVPGVDGAAGVDRRDRWQLQLYGIACYKRDARWCDRVLARVPRVNCKMGETAGERNRVEDALGQQVAESAHVSAETIAGG
jgi:hypothetical protein